MLGPARTPVHFVYRGFSVCAMSHNPGMDQATMQELSDRRPGPIKPTAQALRLLQQHFDTDHPDAGPIGLDRIAYELDPPDHGPVDPLVIWDRGRYAFLCSLCPRGMDVKVVLPKMVRKAAAGNEPTNTDRRRKAIQHILLGLVATGMSSSVAITTVMSWRDTDPDLFRETVAKRVPGANAKTLEYWTGGFDLTRRTFENYWRAIPEPEREAALQKGDA